jgi:hypothetical protein
VGVYGGLVMRHEKLLLLLRRHWHEQESEEKMRKCRVWRARCRR